MADEVASTYQPTECSPDGFFADDTDQNCSVKVAVRVRPMVGRELREGSHKNCINASDSGYSLQIGERDFRFDRVFSQKERQVDIFEVCARNLILGCFGGYNATILAYGQTGSGKTHTMGTGSTVGLSLEQVGIVPRVFDFIFEEVEKRQAENEFNQFTVKLQFLELYGEDIHDLFDAGSIDKASGQSTKQIQIREEKGGNISVTGLKSEIVANKAECVKLLNTGISHRVTSATLMNEGSSRSHAIFTITIDQKITKIMPTETDDQEPVTSEEHISAKFHFVDLAGSERIKKTGATGKLMQEGISINKGLLSLGNVISALTEDKKSSGGFIPYRDSKLTRILQDSLGGNSRTTMIACVSPSDNNYDETLSTIKYASRARNIKNKPIVNRDANSMLIEALQGQISTLQATVVEYQGILTKNNIPIPNEIAIKVQESKPEAPILRRSSISQQSVEVNSGELRELKMKLAKKERDYKDVVAQLEQVKQANLLEKESFSALEKERDELTMKQDSLLEVLAKNNVKAPADLAPTRTEKKTLSLLDDYKQKIACFKEEIEKKNAEILAKSKKISELQTQAKRDDQILKKAVDEAAKLKRNNRSSFNSPSKKRPEPEKQDVPDYEKLQDKIFDKLTVQLESLFTDNESDSTSTQSEAPQLHDEDISATSVHEAKTAHTLEDKEKVLAAVRQNVDKIKSDFEELLKDAWGAKISELQMAKHHVEKERTKKVAAMSNGGAQADSKALQSLDREYKTKMDELNRALESQQRDRRRKEEAVTRTMAQQEARLKAMEAEIARMKKERDELERQKKFSEERFSKLKVSVKQDQANVKKTIAEKEKVATKLKLDLKKTDELVQSKISELKGLQKKAMEENERRRKEEEMENESQGIDIDAIKDWINLNTEQLLKQQQLRDFLKEQQDKKEQIQDEMLDEGDKMTELMVLQERIEQELAELGDDDEGRRLELEAELEDILMDLNSRTEILDNLDENLEYIRIQINELTTQIKSFDMDSVQPPRFKGLNSVEMMRATLRTFFMVFLDLNVYKRDLEQKCIEQDETILNMQSHLSLLQQKGGDLTNAEKKNMQLKAEAISQLMNQIGDGTGYVDNRDMAGMQLSSSEQAALTKMSLSKIVANLRSKLQEEEKKSHSLALKLDMLGREKEQLKEKLTQEVKKQKKPTSVPSTRTTQLSQVKSRINTGLVTQPPPQKKQNTSVEPQPNQGERRLSFKARRNLMKEKGPKILESSSKQSLESILVPVQTTQPKTQYTSLKDRRASVKHGATNQNSQLTDQLAEIEQQLKSQPKTTLQRDKRDYLTKPIDTEALLQSASQPETVLECDEEQEFDEQALLKAQEDRLDQLLVNEEEKEASSESSDDKEKWYFEETANLDIESGVKFIDAAIYEDRVYVLFSDFNLKEICVATKKVISERNIKQSFSDLDFTDEAIAMSASSETQMLAISDSEKVFFFDVTAEGLSFLRTMDQQFVTFIEFSDCYILLLQECEDSDESVLKCFYIDEDSEENSITIKRFLGQNLLLKYFSSRIYFCTGTQIGAIEVPNLELIYQVESEHESSILDFAISTTLLCTTDKKGEIRLFDAETGDILINPLGEEECVSLCLKRDYIIARCGSGQALSIFIFNDGWENVEDEFMIMEENEVEQNELFKMKSGLKIGSEDEPILCIRASPAVEESGSLELKILRRKDE